MRIEVRVESGDEELRSLYSWLRDEPAVRRTADLALLEHPTRPGDMGTVIDALQLLTDNGWSAASFAIALATWRQTRRRSPQITVRRGDMVITLSDCDEADMQRVVAMLEEKPDGEDAHQ